MKIYKQKSFSFGKWWQDAWKMVAKLKNVSVKKEKKKILQFFCF